MADYPSIPIIDGFEQIPRDGRQIDTAADGISRIRIVHADRFDFVVPHSVLSVANLAALRAFYTANRAISFNFTSPEDGAIYVVGFTARPKYKLMNGQMQTVVVHLTQTA